MRGSIETERFTELAQQTQPELAQEAVLETEATVEILGPIIERGNKYGPLGEPSFRRPA